MAKMYRQGDVLLVRDPGLSSMHSRKIIDRGKSIVIQEGEVAGHFHEAIATDDLELRGLDDDRVILSKTGFALVHPEHNTLDIPPGEYSIKIQEEWVSPTRTRPVAD